MVHLAFAFWFDDYVVEISSEVMEKGLQSGWVRHRLAISVLFVTAVLILSALFVIGRM